jgi:pyruvate dehydrogenase phosphatase
MDGVGNIFSGEFDFKLTPHKEDPNALVGVLLGDQIRSHVKDILGHGVESKMPGCNGNRTIEVLGNLLGGTDIGRLSMSMDLAMLFQGKDTQFYIDDTSIIVCDIFKVMILS